MKGLSRRPLRMAAEDASFWQRYRVIIIAVTLFIVIDLGVLVLNFYTSFQIAEDALGVNLSGRQRMLSQRMTKALLTLDIEQRDGKDSTAALEELSKAVALFDQTFKGFQGGATVPGGDGKLVFLKAAEGQRARSALSQAAEIWTPYQTALQPVLTQQASPAQLAAAVSFARVNNVKLLGLMNDLTTALEAHATERATHLRRVQAAGILLALLNFAYILYKFLSSLRRADQQIMAANTENQEILDSVREGLYALMLHSSCASPIMGTHFAGIGAIPYFYLKDLRYGGVSHLFEVGSCTDIVRFFFVL
jgi:nitrate/nitrite-specific signal transduction histidine kinase